MIGLKEALELLDGDPQVASTNPELLEFVADMVSAGSDVLKGKDDTYITGAVALMESTVLTVFLTRGDIKEFMQCMKLMDDGTLGKICALVFRFSIGLSDIEGLNK